MERWLIFRRGGTDRVLIAKKWFSDGASSQAVLAAMRNEYEFKGVPVEVQKEPARTRIEQAAEAFLFQIDTMTSEDFALGVDREAREKLRALLWDGKA